jgi:TonB family protein
MRYPYQILPVIVFALLLIACRREEKLRAPATLYTANVDSTTIDSLYVAGWQDCATDISHGKLTLKLWGLPDEDAAPIFVDLLKEKLGIETEGMAGCVVNPGEQAQWSGYNDHLTEYLDRKYGKGSLKAIARMADSLAPRIRLANQDSVLGLLRFPKEAGKRRVNGKVLIRAKVNVDGSVSEATVLRSLGFGCDAEALRLVSLMRFQPFPLSRYAKPKDVLIPIRFDSSRVRRAP